MLADIVSKNGNLLLSVPVRADGTIDDAETRIVEQNGVWMDVNREAIFGTRPWLVFGEGPAIKGAPLHAQGFNEGKGKPFTAEDIRFTLRPGSGHAAKGDVLYAIVLGAPEEPVTMKSLATGRIAGITLLGSDEKVRWTQTGDALTIQPPERMPSDIAVVFKVLMR